MKIDLHNHTTASPDSITSPEQMVSSALRKGIGAIAVSDHNTMKGIKAVEKAARGKPLTVIPAEEMSCKEGHLIGLFLVEEIEGGLPVEEVLDEIKSQGALSYAPHPFDTLRHGINDAKLLQKIDIIEGYNSKATDEVDERARAFASANGKALGAGSDSHTPEEVGRAYVEAEDEEINTPEQLLKALKRGELKLERRTTLLEKVVRKATLGIKRFLSS